MLCGIAIHFSVAAQWKAGIGQYFYTRVPFSEAFVPVAHIESPNNFYAELRYNYEDLKTLSLYIGKTLTGGNNLVYTITPMLGYSTGRFTGISLGANTDAGWKKFFLSSQTQYSITIKKSDSLSTKNTADNFFFTWSELAYNFSDHFFGGLSIQYTRQAGENNFEPGLLAGLNFKNFSFPFYVFKPLYSERYFVLGVEFQFNFKQRKKIEL